MTALYPWYPIGTAPSRQSGTSSPGQNVRGVAAPKQGMRRKWLPPLVIGLLCSGPCGLSHHGRRQPECESSLKGLFVATRTVPHGRLPASPTLSDFPYFAPMRGNRNAYFLGPGPVEDRSGPDAVTVVGQMGIGVDTHEFPSDRALTLEDLPPQIAKQVGGQFINSIYHFTAACAGNADDNPGDIPDIWTLSSQDRMINGVSVAGGDVFHHVNDKTTH